MWSFTQQVQLYTVFCYFEKIVAWRLDRSWGEEVLTKSQEGEKYSIENNKKEG
jgi:hypothetical protein